LKDSQFNSQRYISTWNMKEIRQAKFSVAQFIIDIVCSLECSIVSRRTRTKYTG